MLICDQQEKVLSSQKVLLWIFLQIRNLFLRYAELNSLLVGSGLIPLNIKLQQDDRTVCCGHITVKGAWLAQGGSATNMADQSSFIHYCVIGLSYTTQKWKTTATKCQNKYQLVCNVNYM